ncbi:hypothetical protein [Streptomyces sp. NBC_00582]|uniref:hypothetical protein n=1 Tax=Streptomyces sp. NBC_00582 TaxID=2975783 RepID=UPI002E7FB7D4|nr:hypothetical protein [Streptomyces sp. NBC_00582]WUB61504.1 hypothetical protein OG852_14445 [Streptomyces sp. NBC_00582]
MDRTDVIAGVLRRPTLRRRLLGHELRGRLIQGLGRGSTVPEWTATIPQLAEDLDTAVTAADAAAAAITAASAGAGHALVVEQRGIDLVGTCQCGRPLGRIRPGSPLDALAVPWITHTTDALAASAIRATA